MLTQTKTVAVPLLGALSATEEGDFTAGKRIMTTVTSEVAADREG